MLLEDVTIKIPTEIKYALRIPERELESRLRLELAVHLYEEWLLSFGKAVAFAQMPRWEFAAELAKRKITRHYTAHELEEDLAFAGATGSR
jgi:predicted HTH domain antitoxin